MKTTRQRTKRINVMIIASLMLLWTQMSFCQVTKTDSIEMPSFTIVYPCPGEYKKSVFNYEEGTMVGFMVSEDSAIINVTEGAMIFITPKDSAKLMSQRYISGLLSDNQYKYIEDGECYYERIIHIVPYNLFITYEHVKSTEVKKYNFMFGNLLICKKT